MFDSRMSNAGFVEDFLGHVQSVDEKQVGIGWKLHQNRYFYTRSNY